MVGRLLVGFVWLCRLFMGFVCLNLQFSVSWLVDFQWSSCGSIFCFLCYGRQTFSGVRVAQSLDFCVMLGRLLVGFVCLNLQFSVSWQIDFQWGSCGSIFSFLFHGRQTFSGVRVAQSFVFCVMVGRLLVGFVWLNLQFYVSWLIDFQWGSCGSIFSFLCHGRQTFSGFCVAQSLVLCHGRQIFRGVRVAQSLVFCVMVGRLLVGFRVAQSLVLCHGRQTFSGVRVAQSLVFCVMVGRFQWASCGSIFSLLCHGRQTFIRLRVSQSFVFCVMVGSLLVGFVLLNFLFSVSWFVDIQWGSRGSIFSFLCHGWQTFSGVAVVLSLVFCVMVGRLLVGFVWFYLQFCASWQVYFWGVRVAQSLVFCVMVGSVLVRFVWLNLKFSVSWLVDFQWGSCGSIFSFLCHGWQTFSGVRVAQSFVFCVMVGRLLVGFVWFYLQFCASWQVYFWGVRVAQSLVFCVLVGRPLVGFVWLNLKFSVSWLVDFQWGSCGSIFSFLCHGWETFSGVRVAQSFVFCVMVGIFLVGFVWLNLQFSASWLVDFQWGS